MAIAEDKVLKAASDNLNERFSHDPDTHKGILGQSSTSDQGTSY